MARFVGDGITNMPKKIVPDFFYTMFPRSENVQTIVTKYMWLAFNTKEDAEHCMEYLKSNFARFALSLVKNGLHIDSGELAMVPWFDDFSKSNDILCRLFTKEELDFMDKVMPAYYDSKSEVNINDKTCNKSMINIITELLSSRIPNGHEINKDYFSSPTGHVARTGKLGNNVPTYAVTLQKVDRKISQVRCESALEFDRMLLYGDTAKEGVLGQMDGFLKVVFQENGRARIIPATPDFNPSNMSDVVTALDTLIDENTIIDSTYSGQSYHYDKKNSSIYVSDTAFGTLGATSYKGFSVHKLSALEPGDMLFVPEYEFIDIFYKSAIQHLPVGIIISELGIGYSIEQRPIFHSTQQLPSGMIKCEQGNGYSIKQRS